MSPMSIWVPHDCSQSINKQGLHGLLDHRGVVHIHECSVLQALVTERSYVFVGYRIDQLRTAETWQRTDSAKPTYSWEEQGQSHHQQQGRSKGSSLSTAGQHRTALLTIAWMTVTSKWYAVRNGSGIKTWQNLGFFFKCERYRKTIL